ncbi:Holliday junction resolvase RuvX [Thiorhodospira sibirica]|uniref:Holliday junction resolvase RuvX n=1 Tax=Thiorhodospira sibirica TaxID=154347 RepID=UPI0006808B1A|nr:Holliday junction resolvase RuvX [Thiorhodospira sibirica]
MPECTQAAVASASARPRMITLLGFDYGTRRIGVAVGNRYTQSANPLEVVANRASGPDWQALDALVKDWQPEGLVIGWVSYADGREHPLARAIQRFADQLGQRYGLPLYRVNEYASSAEASARLEAARQHTGRKRSKTPALDPLAASLLLEQWFAEHPL